MGVLAILFNSNRGQIQDIVVFGAVLFVVFVSLIIGARLLDDVNTAFQKTDSFSDQSKEDIADFNSRFPAIIDGVIVLTFVILGISLIITAFLVDTHPIFFAISLPSFLVVMMVNAILANAMDDVGNTTALFGIYSQLTMTNFIAQHWVAMITIIGFVSFMVFFSKK